MTKNFLILILILSSAIGYAGAQEIRCADNCASPSSYSCRCGPNLCASGEVCGFADIQGNKQCFAGGSTACLPRSFVAVGRLLCILLLLTPALVVIMLILGVIITTVNADNPEKRSEGKEYIKNAIIGALIVLAIVEFAAVVGIDVDYSTCASLDTGITIGGPPPPPPTTTIVTTTTTI
ncbi:MAG: hypothetical protein V1921_03845 [Candidatus Altiarchaeota archaeon]